MYKAQLRSENKPEETMQQTFRMEQGAGFSANQAYNLLSGRAIQKEYITIEGQRQNTWVQLDFNDKDAAGNFRMKEFHAGYGYDLRQVLSQLPLKETSMDAKEKLMNDLINGSRQQVTFLKEGKKQAFYIEANQSIKHSIFTMNIQKRLVWLLRLEIKRQIRFRWVRKLTYIRKWDMAGKTDCRQVNK